MSRARRRKIRQEQSGTVLLWQMQRGIVAEPAVRRIESPGRALAPRRFSLAIDARRRAWMAEVPLLVHGARPERDGYARGEFGVEVCGARARTHGNEQGYNSRLRVAPAGVGDPHTQSTLELALL